MKNSSVLCHASQDKSIHKGNFRGSFFRLIINGSGLSLEQFQLQFQASDLNLFFCVWVPKPNRKFVAYTKIEYWGKKILFNTPSAHVQSDQYQISDIHRNTGPRIYSVFTWSRCLIIYSHWQIYFLIKQRLLLGSGKITYLILVKLKYYFETNFGLPLSQKQEQTPQPLL